MTGIVRGFGFTKLSDLTPQVRTCICCFVLSAALFLSAPHAAWLPTHSLVQPPHTLARSAGM